jgi:hypothetical protein
VAPVLTITAPTGGSYTQGSNLTVSWNTSPTLTTGQFGVWLYDGTTWTYSQLVAAGGSNSATVALSVSPGSTYQAVVAYRPNAGIGAFVAWATSSIFTVTAP